MQKKIVLMLVCAMVSTTAVFGQKMEVEQDTTFRKFFLGSTLFMLGNFGETNRPDFVQLNLGYRINPKNSVSIELKTWKYAWSLGIPFGESFQAPELEFPGYIREFGFAIAYQHFWWKGLYSAVHIMNAHQTFVDSNGDKIKNGYQMFNTYRLLGYQFKFFKNRFFIEPSIAVTHRPFQSKMPDGFATLNNKWPSYFVGEPGLHFGFNF